MTFYSILGTEYVLNPAGIFQSTQPPGKQDKLKALRNFWTPTSAMIDGAKDVKTTEIINTINEIMHDHLFVDGNDKCPKCGGKLGIKLSKYGAFIGCENYPKCNYTKKLSDIDPEKVDEEKSEKTDKAKSVNIDLGNGISFRIGRFGPYVTNGKKNVPAKQYTDETITLDIAKDLLENGAKKADPINLGDNPATGKPIFYYPTGRYGAYISSNRVNVSVKEQPNLETAIDLINNKKPSTKFKRATKK